MNRRQEALCDVLGTSQIPAPKNYPETITLPQPVHEVTLRALAETALDTRERSAGLKYRLGEWTVGRLFSGTPIELKGNQFSAHANHLHTLSTTFLQPNLHLHTHPLLPDELVEAVARMAVASTETPKDAQVEDFFDRVKFAGNLAVRLPSSGDITTSYVRSGGNTGQIVASETGIFAWLSKDTKEAAKRNPLREEAEARRRIVAARFRKVGVFARDSFWIGEDDDSATLAATNLKMEAVRAWVLAPRFVCYSNQGPNSPELHKVKPMGPKALKKSEKKDTSS